MAVPEDLTVSEMNIIHGLANGMAAVEDFHELCSVSALQRLTDLPPSADADGELQIIADELLTISQRLEHTLMRRYPNDKRFLRLHLLTEESGEFAEGLSERNEVKTLNALADIMYVTKGAAVTMDLPLPLEFVEVHRSNMTKEKQPDDPSAERVRSKGPNYVEPNTAGVLAGYRQAQERS